MKFLPLAVGFAVAPLLSPSDAHYVREHHNYPSERNQTNQRHPDREFHVEPQVDAKDGRSQWLCLWLHSKLNSLTLILSRPCLYLHCPSHLKIDGEEIRGNPDKREHSNTRTSVTNTRVGTDTTEELRGNPGKREHIKARSGTKTGTLFAFMLSFRFIVSRGKLNIISSLMTAEHESTTRAHARNDDGPSMIVGGSQADVAEYPYYGESNMRIIHAPKNRENGVPINALFFDS